MQEEIAELNKKIDALQEKMAKNAEIIDEKRNATKEQIDAEISKAKDSVESAKDRAKASAESIKGAAAEEVSKFQAGIDAAKQKIADKKEAIDKHRLEKYIDDTIDYSASCLNVALVAAEEAKLAALEAIAAQMDYIEKYGG